MSSLPTVAIIFPNYNGGQLPLDCLKSIALLTYPKNKIEAIVVDNGSQDGSDVQIKNLYPKVRLIKNAQNQGFAKAVNQAVKFAKSQYLFITNNDVVLDKKCLVLLIEYLLQNPKVGIVGPKIFNLNKPGKVLGRPLSYHFFLGVFTQGPDALTPQEVDWVQGCGLLCSKKLFQDLNGFDEEFFFIGEELDLCLRAKRLGHKIVYLPKSVLWHSGGATIGKVELNSFRFYEGYKSKLRLILKHANIFAIISALFIQLFIFTPYRSIILREKSFSHLIKALIWNFKHISQTFKARRKIVNG